MAAPDTIHVLDTNKPIAQPDQAQPAADAAAQRLYHAAASAMVELYGPGLSGSGFFVDGEGDVVTDAHVVAGQTSIVAVTSDGKRYRATLEKISDTSDLAEVKIEGIAPTDHTYLQLGDDTKLQAGAKLYGLGHPFGYRPTYISPGYYRDSEPMFNHEDPVTAAFVYQHSSDQGKQDLVNALSRSVGRLGMHLEPGDSGGPILDSTGKVVGVTDYADPKNRSDSYFTSVADVKAMINDKSNKFQFHYGFGPTPSALRFPQQWADKGGYAHGILPGLDFMQDASSLFASDLGQLKKSSGWRDQVKYSMAVVSDAVMMAGSVAGPLPLLGVEGMIGRRLADQVPNYPIVQSVTRSNGDKTPLFEIPEFIPTLGP